MHINNWPHVSPLISFWNCERKLFLFPGSQTLFSLFDFNVTHKFLCVIPGIFLKFISAVKFLSLRKLSMSKLSSMVLFNLHKSPVRGESFSDDILWDKEPETHSRWVPFSISLSRQVPDSLGLQILCSFFFFPSFTQTVLWIPRAYKW